MQTPEHQSERPWQTQYSAHQIEVILQTPALRILEATFAVGDAVPMHTHTNVVDHFWVISGTLEIETVAPNQRVVLGSGGYFSIPPGCAHSVRNTGTVNCHFVNLQGFGRYDFNLQKEQSDE